MKPADVEILSAYLDGQLSLLDSARLESRLKSEENLRRLMGDVQLARGLLRQLPKRRAPRGFTLKATNPKLRVPEPRAYPALRLAGVLASFLFLASFALNALTPLAPRQPLAASAPYLGGGASGGPAAVPLNASPAPPFAAAAPSAATEMPQARAQTPLITQAPAEAAPKALTYRSPQTVPMIWQVLLGGAAVIFSWLSWFLWQRGLRNFRRRWIEK